MSDAQARTLCTELARGFVTIGVRTWIGFVDKRNAPDVLGGFDGLPDQKIEDKQLAVFAFGAAITPLIQTYTVDRIKIWIDPDRTKIDWWGKRPQAKNALGFWADFVSLSDPNKTKPKAPPPEKRFLLDAADLLSCSSAKVLSDQSRSEKSFFRDLMKIFNPQKTDLFLGTDPSKNSYVPG